MNGFKLSILLTAIFNTSLFSFLINQDDFADAKVDTIDHIVVPAQATESHS